VARLLRANALLYLFQRRPLGCLTCAPQSIGQAGRCAPRSPPLERPVRRALLFIAALIAGLAAGDAAVVVAGGTGLRRAGPNVARLMRRALALVLAVFGLWLIFL